MRILTFCNIALFFASVCMPSQWPRFFKMALSEKLLVVLSARRITWEKDAKCNSSLYSPPQPLSLSLLFSSFLSHSLSLLSLHPLFWHSPSTLSLPLSLPFPPYMYISSLQPPIYLDIPIGLPQDYLTQSISSQSVHKVDVEAVKVWFNGSSLHHQVLGHPINVVVLNETFELFSLRNVHYG